MAEDYAPAVADLFTDPDTREERSKRALQRLEPAERVVLTLYAELASIRDLAALLGVSRSTLCDELKRIRTKVITIIDNDA